LSIPGVTSPGGAVYDLFLRQREMVTDKLIGQATNLQRHEFADIASCRSRSTI